MKTTKDVAHLKYGSTVRFIGTDRHPKAGQQCMIMRVLPNPSGGHEHQWYDVKFDDGSYGRFLERCFTGALEDIPANRWREFFESFSGRHEDWLVQLEILDRTLQPVASRQLRLKSITAEDSPDKMILIVGEDEADEVSQLVRRPSRVLLTQTGDRADKSLEIYSEDVIVALRFRVAMLPELVDGVA